MKKFGLVLLSFGLALTGMTAQSASAANLPVSVAYEVKGLKATSKSLSAKQIKFIKNKISKHDNYVEMSCWVVYGPDVTEAKAKKLQPLALKVCREAEKVDKNLDTDYEGIDFDDNETSGALYILIEFVYPRILTFYADYSSGTVPDPSAPVKFNGKVTLPPAGDLENKGLEFLGWTFDSEGSGRVYLPGDKIRLKKEKTIYAKWDGYNIDVTVTYIGDIGLGHVGFNYLSPYSNAFDKNLLGLVDNETFEVGGYDGSDQIKFTAPGDVAESALTISGNLEITSYGGGTCGWSLDYQDCTVWDIKVTGDGSLSYSMIQFN
jgi:hypothetical protein